MEYFNFIWYISHYRQNYHHDLSKYYYGPGTETPAEKRKAANEAKMKKEDEFTVKPYVLQPPIKLNNDKQ